MIIIQPTFISSSVGSFTGKNRFLSMHNLKWQILSGWLVLCLHSKHHHIKILVPIITSRKCFMGKMITITLEQNQFIKKIAWKKMIIIQPTFISSSVGSFTGKNRFSSMDNLKWQILSGWLVLCLHSKHYHIKILVPIITSRKYFMGKIYLITITLEPNQFIKRIAWKKIDYHSAYSHFVVCWRLHWEK